MAIARKCDRCGQFFEFYSVYADGRNAIGFNTLTQGCYSDEDGCHYKKSYDLCPDCCREFNAWLEEANEE